jgi:hypothetical protein
MSNSEFEPGDLVRYSVVGVVEKSDDMDHFIMVREAQSGEPMVFPVVSDRYGSARTKLIHRPKKKPPVGSYITGETLAKTWWKRGTTFINQADEILTVTFDGFIRVDNTVEPRHHLFQEFQPGRSTWTARFKLVHLGGSENEDE